MEPPSGRAQGGPRGVRRPRVAPFLDAPAPAIHLRPESFALQPDGPDDEVRRSDPGRTGRLTGAMGPSAELVARWKRNREWTRRFFHEILTPQAWLERPIALRHPFVFYEGHLAAFAVNTFLKRALGQPGIDPAFEERLHGGIDPLDASGVRSSSWPERDRIGAYIRAADEGIAAILESRMPAKTVKVLLVILEHEEHLDRLGGHSRLEDGRDPFIRGTDVGPDAIAFGPGRRSNAGGVEWIDPAFEERLHGGIDPGLSERPLQKRVDREGCEMPFVEHERVTERDGPLEPSLRRQNLVKEAARPLPVALPPRDELRARPHGARQAAGATGVAAADLTVRTVRLKSERFRSKMNCRSRRVHERCDARAPYTSGTALRTAGRRFHGTDGKSWCSLWWPTLSATTFSGP